MCKVKFRITLLPTQGNAVMTSNISLWVTKYNTISTACPIITRREFVQRAGSPVWHFIPFPANHCPVRIVRSWNVTARHSEQMCVFIVRQSTGSPRHSDYTSVDRACKPRPGIVRMRYTISLITDENLHPYMSKLDLLCYFGFYDDDIFGFRHEQECQFDVTLCRSLHCLKQHYRLFII